MSVYVGELRPCVQSRNWRLALSAHLFADSLVELDGFAARMGMPLAWFQVSRTGWPHYDLTPGMRRKALRYGAKAADVRTTVRHLLENSASFRRERLGLAKALLRGAEEADRGHDD